MIVEAFPLKDFAFPCCLDRHRAGALPFVQAPGESHTDKSSWHVITPAPVVFHPSQICAVNRFTTSQQSAAGFIIDPQAMHRIICVFIYMFSGSKPSFIRKSLEVVSKNKLIQLPLMEIKYFFRFHLNAKKSLS